MATLFRVLVVICLASVCQSSHGQELPPRKPQASPKPIAKDYKIGPDSMPQDGVPKGKLDGPFLFKSKIIPGTVHKYWIYVPARYTPEKSACVLVFQDGQRAINPKGVLQVPNVMDNLIHRKEMPVTIGIFITPGQRGEEYPESLGTGNPNNRSVEYDSLGDTYARFLTEEILPVSRLWCAATDYSGDLGIDDKILARVVDTYRRIRNTLKFFARQHQRF